MKLYYEIIMKIKLSELFQKEHQKKFNISTSEVESTIDSPDKKQLMQSVDLTYNLFLKKFSDHSLLIESKLENGTFEIIGGFPLRNDFEGIDILEPKEILEKIMNLFGYVISFENSEYNIIFQKTVTISNQTSAHKLFEIKNLRRYNSFIQNTIIKQTKSPLGVIIDILVIYSIDDRKFKSWFESGCLNPYTIPRTAGERADRFIELRLKIRKIRNKQKASDKDVRLNGLNNCSWAISSQIMTLNLMEAYETQKIDGKLLISIFKFSRGDPKVFLEIYAKSARLGFVTLIQFQIENMLKNILAKLIKENPPQGYYKLSRLLLETLQITDLDQKHKILDTLQSIRNSYHSNGIHTKKSKKITINCHDYLFEEGKTVNCSEWGELHLLLMHIFNIIEEILDHPKIQAITEEIPDQFIPN